MPFAKKVVLYCPNGMPAGMAGLAAQFVIDGVKLVASVGPSSREIEDIVDDAAIAAGSPETSFILTSAHPYESLADVVEYTEGFVGEYGGLVQVVELREWDVCRTLTCALADCSSGWLRRSLSADVVHHRNTMLADLTGIEFDWFAADSEGNLALFATSGEGFLPEGVAENHEMHSTVSESLPAPRVGSAEVWLDYADVGFYVFDWALPGGPYELRASPTRELERAIRQQVLAVTNMPRFSGSFSNTTKVESWK